jgi:hypothetical protein
LAGVLIPKRTDFYQPRLPQVEFPPLPHDFHDGSGCEGRVMGQTAHHNLIVDTANGFCGIASNDVSITRFQLPTESAAVTERLCCAERPAPSLAHPRRG